LIVLPPLPPSLLLLPLLPWLLLLLLQVMSVVGILQDETDPMVSVMKVRQGPARQQQALLCLSCCSSGVHSISCTLIPINATSRAARVFELSTVLHIGTFFFQSYAGTLPWLP
jgi:hypothetical protein